MSLLKVFRLNLKIIQVMNSCDRKQFVKLIDEVINQPKVFTQKRYIWNIIRGRDFYKMLSWYTTSLVNESQSGVEDCGELLNKAETIIHMVVSTAGNEDVIRSYIWNVTKHAHIITLDTIRYTSPERIRNMLTSDNVVTDQYIAPVMETLAAALRKNNELAETNSTIVDLM